MRNELDKYIQELPAELQEKAKECKDMAELNSLLAEHDVELSEDALEAVAGGCTVKSYFDSGTVFKGDCPNCGGDLLYHDTCYEKVLNEIRASYIARANCVNGCGLFWARCEDIEKNCALWRRYYR